MMNKTPTMKQSLLIKLGYSELTMKKTNFLEKLELLKVDAEKSIKKVLKENQPLKLISDEDADNGTDEFYDLPEAIFIGKYDSCDFYKIVSVIIEDGTINLEGFGSGENLGDKRFFGLEDLTPDNFLYLADLISEKAHE